MAVRSNGATMTAAGFSGFAVMYRRFTGAALLGSIFVSATLLGGCVDTAPPAPIVNTYIGVDTIVRQIADDNPTLCGRAFQTAVKAVTGFRYPAPAPFRIPPYSLLLGTDPAVNYYSYNHHGGLYGLDCKAFGPVLVATVADSSNLSKSSPFGRMVSDQIESRLAQQGFSVIDSRLGRSFVVSKDGQFILTSDLKNMAHNQNAGAVLVGTYTDADSSVMVSLKMLRVIDGAIISGSDYTVALSDGDRQKLLPPMMASTQYHQINLQ